MSLLAPKYPTQSDCLSNAKPWVLNPPYLPFLTRVPSSLANPSIVTPIHQHNVYFCIRFCSWLLLPDLLFPWHPKKIQAQANVSFTFYIFQGASPPETKTSKHIHIATNFLPNFMLLPTLKDKFMGDNDFLYYNGIGECIFQNCSESPGMFRRMPLVHFLLPNP